MYQHKNNSESM